ncbi:hypothetical protein ALC53_10216 [Atta colombica]|uniref:Uncharacterized protein n=1 Tax=Atta colombica TaxID=520822 RepID=A0A151I0L5_9HYME|nr:hypothetical protein ALC53_10216 [Atta colombica]
MAEYLRKDNLGEGKRGKEVRTLFKLRCRNLEEGNKYWVFCGKGKDNLQHYVKECSEIKERFTKLEKDKEEILRKLC